MRSVVGSAKSIIGMGGPIWGVDRGLAHLGWPSMVVAVRRGSSTAIAWGGGRRRRLAGQEASRRTRETLGSRGGGKPWPGTTIVAKAAPWRLGISSLGLPHDGRWLECGTARVKEAGMLGQRR
jgi:hypothetical protein